MSITDLRGASREALREGRAALEQQLTSGRRGTPAMTAIAEDLFSVTDLLAGAAPLRKALTDPSRDGADRAALAARLLEGKISDGAYAVVRVLAGARWSGPRDLVEATEQLAVSALLAAADKAGRLDAVEDELFRFGRLVARDMGLRDAFAERTPGADRKAALVTSLLSGKAAPETVRLARQAAVAPRGVGTEEAITAYVEAAAQRRSQLIAEVVTAVPLSADQVSRLEAALTRIYGTSVRTTVEVDPELVGGVRVAVAGEVIDASVLNRLATVRQRLAG